MIRDYYSSYQALGLTVIPIEWDVKAKSPVSHRNWSDTTTLTLCAQHNALMIKTDGVYGCIDFDIKNTTRKTVFDEWKTLVLSQWPEVYDKLYIEKTRNDGYHVWLSYDKLNHKLALAESDKGSEVIALYAKGPLVYTFPTPGYTEYSSSMADISPLTGPEFEFLVSTSQVFNEYKPTYDPSLKAINYPKGYETLLTQFDAKLPDEAWEFILEEIGLTPIQNYRHSDKDNFAAYRRSGSASPALSAKVYFRTKRVLIFSASLHDFPNWHNRYEYPVWSLPPSFVLFYKNGRSWDKAIAEINAIIESIGIDIETTPALTTGYPLHVFPEWLCNSMIDVCASRSLPIEFVSTSALFTISSLAGNRYLSDFNGDGKNILFCLMIAPVSAGKTPAFKVMCETPLKEAYDDLDRKYEQQLTEYNAKKSAAFADKKPFNDKRPLRYIPFAADGTTEGYISKSMQQVNGIGVYQDEAETILNAGNFKAENDAISFFTQAFSGGRVTQIRADETKERVVPNLNLNLLMGTQPDRLKNIFTEDKLASGFASRFIMVESGYKELNTDSDPFGHKKEMCAQWKTKVTEMFYGAMYYNSGDTGVHRIFIGDDAKNTYRAYHRRLLEEANTRITSKAENYIIGTEAKMSAYFPRLCQVLAIIHNHTAPEITPNIVHYGWQLYRYYATSTINIIAGLHTEIDTGLPKELELLYAALPEEFTRKQADEVCTRLNLAARRFEYSLRRKDFSRLLTKLGQGKYRKTT